MPMQTVTKPIMLDETGQAIVVALSGLTDAVKPDAINIPYDNTDSGLISETVQGAIDENTDSISELNSSLTSMFKIITSQNYSVTVPANGAINVTANNLGLVTPLGYSAISCRSYFANSNDLVWRSMDVSAQGTQSFGVIRNVSGASVTATIIITIVYAKLSLF